MMTTLPLPPSPLPLPLLPSPLLPSPLLLLLPLLLQSPLLLLLLLLPLLPPSPPLLPPLPLQSLFRWRHYGRWPEQVARQPAGPATSSCARSNSGSCKSARGGSPI